MNIFKKNQLRKLMEKRRKERKEISELNTDQMLKNIREKKKPIIKPNELPF